MPKRVTGSVDCAMHTTTGLTKKPHLIPYAGILTSGNAKGSGREGGKKEKKDQVTEVYLTHDDTEHDFARTSRGGGRGRKIFFF